MTGGCRAQVVDGYGTTLQCLYRAGLELHSALEGAPEHLSAAILSVIEDIDLVITDLRSAAFDQEVR